MNANAAFGNQNKNNEHGSPYAQPQHHGNNAPMGANQIVPGKWSTRMAQHSDPIICSEICLGCFLCPIAAAIAKSRVDRSNCCVNLMCFMPCWSFAYVRMQYGITGICGDDCCYGVLCPCCTNRQALTETRLRGQPQNAVNYGSNTREWNYSLFDCSCFEMCRTCICPCCVAADIHENLQPQADSCCFDTFCMNPMGMYGQVRVSYGIITDFPCLEDTCLPVVCFVCALNRAKKQSEKFPNPSRLSNK